MKRKWDLKEEQYFGIGIYKPKTEENIGTLWRTAFVLGADFIFTIEGKYKNHKTDVFKAWSRIPLFQFEDFEHFRKAQPYSCQLVGIEQDKSAALLQEFEHPGRAVYLLGSEDQGLPGHIRTACQHLVYLPGENSLNVAVAGSIVVYDRFAKLNSK